jgi:hypothetical protein
MTRVAKPDQIAVSPTRQPLDTLFSAATGQRTGHALDSGATDHAKSLTVSKLVALDTCPVIYWTTLGAWTGQTAPFLRKGLVQCDVQ